MAEQTTGTVLAVGDHVRLKSRAANQHQSFQLTRDELSTQYEPVDGIILSIRDIATGRLLPRTEGYLEQYVIELLNERTFSVRYASQRNAPRGTDHPSAAPAWNRLRDALRQSAENGVLYSSGLPTLFTDSPLAKLLDGWKVLRVRTSEIEPITRTREPEEEE